MDIKKIGVLGAGIMGSVLPRSVPKPGMRVVLVDIAEAFVAKASGHSQKLDQSSGKG